MNPLVVVLPVSRPDYHLAVKWLKWAIALNKHDEPMRVHPLVVLCAASLEANHFEALRHMLFNTHDDWICIQIEELHERPDLGYAYAANCMFKAALETTEQLFRGSPMLWIEADTTPTRSTWVQEIAAEYAVCRKVFMGDFHPHGTIPHMTGNAVYGPQWREAAPSLAALPGPHPHQGWDSSCAFQTVPQMHKAKTIQQVWICPRFTESNVNSIVRPETALFHRCKDGSLIDVLAARAGIAPIPLGAPLCPPTSTVGDPAPEGPRPPRVPRVQIMIVTYAKDMEFLRYCLKSIRQFAHGFAGVTLVVPEQERGQYDWVKGAEVRYFHEETGKGMLAHEREICRADLHCPNADFIVHVDADCIFFRPVTPAAYVTGERALVMHEPYTKITNPNRHLWKHAVKRAVGIEPTSDFMLRHPNAHPRETYAATRDLVTAHTGREFGEFMLDGPNTFPHRVAEFPMLGTVGTTLFPDRYTLVEYDKEADVRELNLPPGDTFQFCYRRSREYLYEAWSHGGVERYRGTMDNILRGQVAEYYIK